MQLRSLINGRKLPPLERSSLHLGAALPGFPQVHVCISQLKQMIDEHLLFFGKKCAVNTILLVAFAYHSFEQQFSPALFKLICPLFLYLASSAVFTP